MSAFPEAVSLEAQLRYEESIAGLNGFEFALGNNTSRIYFEDPKLLLFTLARYKFVAKMLTGRPRVLEVGCQEAFGSQLVAKDVGHLHCIDFYRPHIESCWRRFSNTGVNMSFAHGDALEGVGNGQFDAAFALDVLEHISKRDEDVFMTSLCQSLTPLGVLILGMPSLESQVYASERSRLGHVNCKSGSEFKSFLDKYFSNTLMFSMNDEVVHTGFFPMAHYLFGIGIAKTSHLL
jgi:cyclopropane fatty-acyl-phospholipid synthase-like methyltransferase